MEGLRGNQPRGAKIMSKQQNRMNRREFMASSAGAVAGAMLLPGAAEAAQAASPAKCAAAATRILGKTGIETSLLGMGTGIQAWNFDSAQIRAGHDQFRHTLIHAYERGLRYFDLADMYGSHQFMRDAMKEGAIPRERLMLLTKTVAKDAETMRADLDRYRLEADTDYFDIILLHCMTDGEWGETMQPCMDVLEEAKQQGIIRAHGVSCHNLDAMKIAAEHAWVDVMLSRINPEGVRMDGTVEEVLAVLQTAHDNGKGMLGMKILGEGDIVDKMEKSLDFVLHCGCIDAITIGFMDSNEVDDTIDHVEKVMHRTPELEELFHLL